MVNELEKKTEMNVCSEDKASTQLKNISSKFWECLYSL